MFIVEQSVAISGGSQRDPVRFSFEIAKFARVDQAESHRGQLARKLEELKDVTIAVPDRGEMSALGLLKELGVLGMGVNVREE